MRSPQTHDFLLTLVLPVFTVVLASMVLVGPPQPVGSLTSSCRLTPKKATN